VKKMTLATMAIAILLVSAVPIITTMDNAQALALAPESCMFAEEFGWSRPGLNRQCSFDLMNENCCDPLGDPWY